MLYNLEQTGQWCGGCAEHQAGGEGGPAGQGQGSGVRAAGFGLGAQPGTAHQYHCTFYPSR